MSAARDLATRDSWASATCVSRLAFGGLATRGPQAAIATGDSRLVVIRDQRSVIRSAISD